jgi:hypothetical protein
MTTCSDWLVPNYPLRPRITIIVVYISNKVTLTLRVEYGHLVNYLMVENLVFFSLNLNKDRSGI